MLHSDIRAVLTQLEEATHTRGCLFLVREASDPHAVRWARGATDLLAADEDALVDAPTSWWDAVEPDDRERVRSVLDGDQPGPVVEYRIRSHAPTWIRESIRRVEIEGDGGYLVSVARDVTAERAGPRRQTGGRGGALPQPTVVGDPLVLLVEDDDAVRSVLARVLTREGFGVLLAGGVAEALRVFDGAPRPPDILVSDVVLPDRPGPELASALHRRREDLPVLFMSGYGSNELIERGELPSGAPMLAKPFTPLDLVRAIRASLEAAPKRRGGGGVVSGPESAAS